MHEATKLGRDDQVSKTPNLLESKLRDDELVLMHPETGTYFGLDAVGAAIWALVDAPTKIGTIIDTIAESYGAEPAVVAADVTELVVSLSANELVTVVPVAS